MSEFQDRKTPRRLPEPQTVTAEADDPKSPYEKLEAATGSLQKEREFFDKLIRVEPAASIVNSIMVMGALYNAANEHLPTYMERRSGALFDRDSSNVVSALSLLLDRIVRSARLSAYMCVKGLAPEAVATMRNALEQIGIYRHIWRDPSKHRFIFETDSADYAKAFRYTKNKAAMKSLEKRSIKYRFMCCSCAKSLSDIYKLLSAYYVHGSPFWVDRDEALSCRLVERSRPEAMIHSFEIVRTLLSIILIELLDCVPREDLNDDDVFTFGVGVSVFLPTLLATPNASDPETEAKVDELLERMAQIKKNVPTG